MSIPKDTNQLTHKRSDIHSELNPSTPQSPPRRDALKKLASGTVAILGGYLVPSLVPAQAQGMGMMGGMMGMSGKSSRIADVKPGVFKRPLPLPPQLHGTQDAHGIQTYALKTTPGGSSELRSGLKTPTWGYNGAVLGPTLRIPQGKPLRIHIDNGLDQSTTVHWHGAHIPGKVDGGPHNLIQPGKSLDVSFTLNQPASTLWYHPHPDGRTGPQVFAGLAGLMLIDDGTDVQLGLPHTYGVDDIPVVLQDRRFDTNGTLDYMSSMMDIMGMKGDHFLVNGVEQPYVEVPGQWVRFRLLNGSNARIYNLAFSDKRAFHVVASDAGLLEQPAEISHLLIAPGERAEIMVDLRHDMGKRLVLQSHSANIVPGLNRMPMATDGYDQSQFDLLELRIGTPVGKPGQLPSKLVTLAALKSDAPERHFVLQGMEMGMMRSMMMGGKPVPESQHSGPGGMSMGVGGRDMFAINDQFMRMNVINQRVRLGTTEIWRVANKGVMGHPFHVHGISFKILSRDGSPPSAHEQGWKDVVLISSGETVHIIAHFTQPAGDEHPFMYHCHILEHEDNGMMGQFTVA